MKDAPVATSVAKAPTNLERREDNETTEEAGEGEEAAEGVDDVSSEVVVVVLHKNNPISLTNCFVRLSKSSTSGKASS